MCELWLVAATVASGHQLRTEGQHGHRATQRQKISGVVQLEADGLFERSDNQAQNNHIGEIIFKFEGCSPRESCRLLLATIQAWIKV